MNTVKLNWDQETMEQLRTLLTEEDVSYQGIVSYIDDHAGRFHLIGVFDDALKGMLVYESEPYKMVIHIVRKEERCKGYGSALLDHLMVLAEETSAARVTSAIPSSASAFYEHYGFEVYGKKTEEDTFLTMEYLLGRRMLGKTVRVIVDHPLGDLHPHLADVQYPINCGYILSDQDEELINAYIIGVDEPIDSFTGVVTAVIYHKDENIMKVAVSKIATSIDHEQIVDSVGFEEQYYDTRIIFADDRHEA